jgi:hypothetical protein
MVVWPFLSIVPRAVPVPSLAEEDEVEALRATHYVSCRWSWFHFQMPEPFSYLLAVQPLEFARQLVVGSEQQLWVLPSQWEHWLSCSAPSLPWQPPCVPQPC